MWDAQSFHYHEEQIISANTTYVIHRVGEFKFNLTHTIHRCAIDSLDLVVCSPNRARQISRHALLHICYIVSKTFSLVLNRHRFDSKLWTFFFFFCYFYDYYRNFGTQFFLYNFFGNLKLWFLLSKIPMKLRKLELNFSLFLGLKILKV